MEQWEAEMRAGRAQARGHDVWPGHRLPPPLAPQTHNTHEARRGSFKVYDYGHSSSCLSDEYGPPAPRPRGTRHARDGGEARQLSPRWYDDHFSPEQGFSNFASDLQTSRLSPWRHGESTHNTVCADEVPIQPSGEGAGQEESDPASRGGTRAEYRDKEAGHAPSPLLHLNQSAPAVEDRAILGTGTEAARAETEVARTETEVAWAETETIRTENETAWSETEAAPSETREAYEVSFVAEVQRFVMRKAAAFDAVVKLPVQASHRPTLHDHKILHANPEPLEYHMGVLPAYRRKRFFDLVEEGDVLQGHVTKVKSSVVLVCMTAFVHSHKNRELADLGIAGVIPFENLAESKQACSELLSEMQEKDVIRAVVMEVSPLEEILTLSIRKDHSPPGFDSALGYMEGQWPDTPRSSPPPDDIFMDLLETDPGYSNAHSSDNVAASLGLSLPSTRPPSLLSDFVAASYPRAEFCDALRKSQRAKWSMETVASGVKLFKSGDRDTAMKFLCHALEIDPQNVEGLVARGALHANGGRYKEAIADFETALTINHLHRNARAYLSQTYVVYGKQLEGKGQIDTAMRCYREALADNPEEETAKMRLGLLMAAKEKQDMLLTIYTAFFFPWRLAGEL